MQVLLSTDLANFLLNDHRMPPRNDEVEGSFSSTQEECEAFVNRTKQIFCLVIEKCCKNEMNDDDLKIIKEIDKHVDLLKSSLEDICMQNLSNLTLLNLKAIRLASKRLV